VVKAVCDYIGLSYENDNNLTAIVDENKATLAQMQNWARSNKATEKFILAAEYYHKYSALTGIRGDILYAQSAKETNFGKYTGTVSEDMNNFAGIKIRNPVGDRKEDFERFTSIDDGVRAHFNHMSAYVGIDPIGRPHPRYFVVKSLSWSGTVRYVQELSGKWATDANYGRSIIQDFLIKMLETDTDYINYKLLYENAKEENKFLRERISALENLIDKIRNLLEG